MNTPILGSNRQATSFLAQIRFVRAVRATSTNKRRILGMESPWPPLCDKCLVPMWPVASSPKMGASECREPDCPRHYDTDDGYYDYVKERKANRSSQRRCPTHGSPLFMYSISPEPTIETWRCPQPDCTHETKWPRPPLAHA
jgi:hypothetical protein